MPSLIDTDPFLATHPDSSERLAIQATLVQAKAEIEGLQATVDYDLVGRYGAVGDGIADDTAKIQDFLDEIAVLGGPYDFALARRGHSRLLMRGIFAFDPAALTWPSGLSITMLVDGFLLPANTLVLDSNRHLTGLGGSTGTQFQAGPVCEVHAPSGQVGIHVTGSAGNVLDNVMVRGSSQPAILVGAGVTAALKKFRNIGVISGHGADADCIRLQHTFWFWIDHFALNCFSDGGYVIRMDDTTEGSVSGTGLGYFSNGIFSTKGMLLRQAFTMVDAGNISIRNVVFENAITGAAFLTVDTPVSAVARIEMDRCHFADSLADENVYVQYLSGSSPDHLEFHECGDGIHVKGPAGTRPALRAHIIKANELYVFTAPKQFDPRPLRLWWLQDGEVDGIDAFRGTEALPSCLPVQNVGVFQEAADWAPDPDLTITGGQTAPDGSSTAYLIETSVNARESVWLWDGVVPSLETGDWLITGIWIKSANDLYPNSENIDRLFCGTGNTLNGASAVVTTQTDRVAYSNTGWAFASGFFRYSGATAPTVQWSLWLSNTANSYFVWKPFMLRVPSTWGERDVARMAAKLTTISQDHTTGGVLTQLPHQTFRTGRGATSARPSAPAVGAGAQWYDETLGRPIYSDGAAWQAGVMNFDAGGNASATRPAVSATTTVIWFNVPSEPTNLGARDLWEDTSA